MIIFTIPVNTRTTINKGTFTSPMTLIPNGEHIPLCYVFLSVSLPFPVTFVSLNLRYFCFFLTAFPLFQAFYKLQIENH